MAFDNRPYKKDKPEPFNWTPASIFDYRMKMMELPNGSKVRAYLNGSGSWNVVKWNDRTASSEGSSGIGAVEACAILNAWGANPETAKRTIGP